MMILIKGNARNRHLLLMVSVTEYNLHSGDHLNCLMNMITNPLSNSHKKTSMIVKTSKRGDSLEDTPPSVGRVVSASGLDVGVFITINVFVGAGKINVITGNGTSVVVGVSVGDEVGVKV
jgi:hypothetical protein